MDVEQLRELKFAGVTEGIGENTSQCHFEISMAVIPYTRIWEVFGSNLGCDIGYPEVFVIFFSFSRQMSGSVSNYFLSNSS
jgi:hypothetical protein